MLDDDSMISYCLQRERFMLSAEVDKGNYLFCMMDILMNFFGYSKHNFQYKEPYPPSVHEYLGESSIHRDIKGQFLLLTFAQSCYYHLVSWA